MTFSIRKLFWLLNVTGSSTCPTGKLVEPRHPKKSVRRIKALDGTIASCALLSRTAGHLRRLPPRGHPPLLSSPLPCPCSLPPRRSVHLASPRSAPTIASSPSPAVAPSPLPSPARSAPARAGSGRRRPVLPLAGARRRPTSSSAPAPPPPPSPPLPCALPSASSPGPASADPLREAREKAAAESQENAAAEAWAKAERAAVKKAAAEARRRAERAVFERVAAEARQRAANEARERAASEARARENKHRAATALPDLESIFGMPSRSSSVPRSQTSTTNPFDVQPQGSSGSGTVRTFSGSAPPFTQPSSSNLMDDLSSIFGVLLVVDVGVVTNQALNRI
ncbi:uncharacterized protein LOC133925481 [Phragmites australis]|uniref:uncharacterized protein LOC133925481 n=1 Tax=Phragmites australis TaxID=29695 RepID=UPI002D7703FD|nr:uncharacterized protein LOC133925481 [Phragmites australis]